MLCSSATKRPKVYEVLQLSNGVECKLYKPADRKTKQLLEMVAITERDGKDGEYGPVAYYGRIYKGKKYVILYDVRSALLKLEKAHKRPRLIRWPRPTETDIRLRPISVSSDWIFEAKSATDDSANIFGQTGSCHVQQKDFLDIPHYHALDVAYELEHSFGIKVIQLGGTLPPEAVTHDVVMAQYVLSTKFVKGWVHHPTNGPGVFLEMHKFPHIMTPASLSSYGTIVAGRVRKRLNRTDRSSHRVLDLIGLMVPFGFSVVLPSDALHSDWYLRGGWATTLAAEDTVEAVFLRGSDGDKLRYRFTSSPTE